MTALGHGHWWRRPRRALRCAPRLWWSDDDVTRRARAIDPAARPLGLPLAGGPSRDGAKRQLLPDVRATVHH
jgi:hypothetical protein